jgi:hypothetical protein
MCPTFLFAAPGDDNGNHRPRFERADESSDRTERPSPQRSGPMSKGARADERTEEGGATFPARWRRLDLEPIAPCDPPLLPRGDRDVFSPAPN